MDDELDDDERVRIERACQRLVDEMAHALDLGPTSRAAELYADDGEFIAGPMHVRGRAALDAHFGPGGPPDSVTTRHTVTNLVVDVVDHDHATGVAYLTYFHNEEEPDAGLPSPLGPPAVLAVYRMEFTRTRRGWRFQREVVEPTHVAPELMPLYRQTVLGEEPGE